MLMAQTILWALFVTAYMPAFLVKGHTKLFFVVLSTQTCLVSTAATALVTALFPTVWTGAILFFVMLYT